MFELQFALRFKVHFKFKVEFTTVHSIPGPSKFVGFIYGTYSVSFVIWPLDGHQANVHLAGNTSLKTLDKALIEKFHWKSMRINTIEVWKCRLCNRDINKILKAIFVYRKCRLFVKVLISLYVVIKLPNFGEWNFF